LFTIGVIVIKNYKKRAMFNLFKKKETKVESPAISPEQSSVSQFLIITAATNFGLVVLPDSKKPLMFAMEPTDTIEMCVDRNVPYVSASVDVANCLVIQLSAELPNHTHAANKIFALVLPDPGILINQDLVVVGYEEIDKIPGPTSSMLKMLVRQVPKEYFAEPTVDPLHKNSPSVTPLPIVPIQNEVASIQPAAETPEVTVESSGFDSAPLTNIETPISTQTEVPILTDLESKDPTLVATAPETPGQTT
jgi:hypothetical protein